MSGRKEEDRGWERGWEGHALAQSLRMARLPLWEKLEWLEQAQSLAACLAKKKLPRDPRQ